MEYAQQLKEDDIQEDRTKLANERKQEAIDHEETDSSDSDDAEPEEEEDEEDEEQEQEEEVELDEEENDSDNNASSDKSLPPSRMYQKWKQSHCR